MEQDEIISEIEMDVALLAALTSPAIAAQALRDMADEISKLQPKNN